MSDYVNSEIVEYISENFSDIIGNITLKNEINEIINNLKNNICSIPYPSFTSYNINGVNEENSGINFSYLIPNLFRACYLDDKLKIPNICPTFIYVNKTIRFLPLLADENVIKSFLYFNFPVNINSYDSNNNFLEKIFKFRFQLYKKKYNTTYASYTNPLDLYNEIYSTNSMLTQMLAFSNYLSNSNNARNINTNINTFDIPWDFTYKCLCYEGILKDTYIAGNKDYDYNITNSYANLIYIINNLNYNIENINTFIYELIGKNNFSALIKYAKSVFEDILMQLQYFISGRDYCEKDYMNLSNIPNLLKLYKNFYNNQISTYKRSLKSTSIANIIPERTNITLYAENFNEVYKLENGKFFLTFFYLNGITGEDAMIFYSNIYTSLTDDDWDVSTTAQINYYYFYLNINFPSGVQLNNIWLDSDTPYEKYEYLDDFVTAFNTYFESYDGTGIDYTIESVEHRSWGNYPSGGYYTYGIRYPDNQNKAYINSYYYTVINQTKLNLNYIIYLSLQTYSPYIYNTITNISEETSGYGVALIIYQNFNN